MRVDRVDAAMAIRPWMVLALKREFLSSGSINSFRRNSSRSTACGGAANDLIFGGLRGGSGRLSGYRTADRRDDLDFAGRRGLSQGERCHGGADDRPIYSGSGVYYEVVANPT
jgi:hypothetical protein